MNDFKTGDNSFCSLCTHGCNKTTDKLNTYDYMADLPDNTLVSDIVEVQFKAPRKGYFHNSNRLPLEKGDIVAVEASPGHDIGTVTMTGRLVALQIRKANLKPDVELKRIYRKVKPADMEKYHEAKAREHNTMIESRQIALDLGLKMKIGDVEYQGDGSKAIFYYIADERVDFRQLIKVLAERFRVRIEMKQIGARQEAGRIGGIGPCGRELCCCTWMTAFSSVSTSAARFQDLSLNPQKLAGQCAKLKCCLNYEADQYVEALKRLPSKEIKLYTIDNEYYFFRADILKMEVTYSTDKHILANETVISARRAFEVINLNQQGIKPERLSNDGEEESTHSLDLLEQDNISRFDKNKKKKHGKGGDNRQRGQGQPGRRNNQPQNNQNPQRNQNPSNNKQGQQRQNNQGQNKPNKPNRPNQPNQPKNGGGQNDNRPPKGKE
jgi:cell fate regulator YaaT (PSP1 superfamily)